MSAKIESSLTALQVCLHGQRIGVINRLYGESHQFSFEPSYLDDPNRATLSLSFKAAGGTILHASRPTQRLLPPFFANLLPEGHLRNYLAAQVGVTPGREFFLLAVLGPDLPGAVTVAPLDAPQAQDLEEMLEEAHPSESARSRRVLRFSLAGVQLKFSAIQESRGALTIPANGEGGSWIVKLPGAQFAAVPENEFVMLELARAIGIDVPRTQLIPVDEIEGLPPGAATVSGKALAIQRFDRQNGEKVHMEDFAQVFGQFPDQKYEGRSYANIASVLLAESGQEDVSELVRRIAFSVLIGNGDMHLKNWSILYHDRKHPRLSPAYDFVSTVPYLPNQTLALSFGRQKSLTEIRLDQVRRFAEQAKLASRPVVKLVADTIGSTNEAWKRSAEKELLPLEIQRQIGEHIQRVSAASLHS